MGLNLAQKLIQDHLVDGMMVPGQEIGLRIDHTLTYDTLGPLTLLQFEAMEIPRVKTKLSLCYVDHNMLQLGAESNNDHRFLQSFAYKYGLRFSRPGNGICHQVHLERFSEPGATLLGTDSHTPTCGAVGMLAIGSGGMDIAVAMGGGAYYLKMPKIVRVHLTGRLQPWVASKDVILELLRRLSVKGGVEKIFEYTGPGVATLTVPQRATICNMGTELGATTSIFPSDENTLAFLKAQGREHLWKALAADPDATYDETIDLDLSSLEPLIACPSSPDNVVPVREVEGTKVQQVLVGSCTNSSFVDLSTTAAILKGKVVHPDVTMSVTPGSRQVFQMISRSGALQDLIDAGVRIIEASCGPCIGMGQSPGTDTVSVRTFNRNFPNRSGTMGDRVYLCSPEVAAATALRGEITDPRRLGEAPRIQIPERFVVDDRMIVLPSDRPEGVEVFKGPNLGPLPLNDKPSDTLRGEVLIKLGDNISTDHIVPGGSAAVPLRSNIPRLSAFAFQQVDPTFAERARKAGGGIIVGGSNYGQGSSRENAAMVPMYLGIKAVLAKSFARIHRGNLTNLGMLALTFANEADYDKVDQGDVLEIPNLRAAVEASQDLVVRNVTKGVEIPVKHAMSPRQVQMYLAGGTLNYVKQVASSK